MKTPPYDNPCRAAVGPLSGGPTRVAIRGPSRAWPTLARPERSKLNPLVHGFKVAATHGRPPLFLDVPVRFATSLPTSAFVRHAQSCIAPPAFTSRQKQCLGFCGAAVGAVGERLEPRPEGEPERAGSAAKRCRARRTSASCTETAPRCRHVRCSAAKSTPMSFRQPCRHGMKQPAN